jgi:predicted amidohydrolase YtcJ
MTVLSEDILKTPKDKIKNIKVEMVISGGRVIDKKL